MALSCLKAAVKRHLPEPDVQQGSASQRNLTHKMGSNFVAGKLRAACLQLHDKSVLTINEYVMSYML